MKTLPRFFAALSCLFFIFAASLRTSAQETAPSPQQAANEVESLRRQVEEQKARIEQLQSGMQQQWQALEKQQRLLETVLQKLEQARPAEARLIMTSASTAPVAAPSEPTGNHEPNAVEAGFGSIKFNGLFQGWFAAGDAGFRDTFRIRRVELKFSGDVAPNVKWTAMIEPSRGLSLNKSQTTIGGVQVVSDTSVNQGSRMLQDAFITLSHVKRMNVDFGQIKLPLGLEGTQSSSRLETIERTLYISDEGRGGGLGDVRDIGVLFYGPLHPSLDYWIGAFNGVNEHQNDVDSNDQKAIVGRLVYRPPFVQGLQVGSSGAWGSGARADQPRRDRLGADALFQNGPFMLKAEVMTAKDRDFHRLGYYGHFGYRLTPRVEGVVRFDTFDPDRRFETNAGNVTERDYIAGLNYFINENHAKLQFNYLHKTFGDDIVKSRNLLLLNLQAAW